MIVGHWLRSTLLFGSLLSQPLAYPSGWRIVAKSSSRGWAWDIPRLRFLINGIEAKPGTYGCQVTESGSIGWPSLSPFKAFETDGLWGGRMVNGRFWLGIKDCTSFVDVTEIRLKQNEGHSVTDFTIEKYQCDVWQHVTTVHTTTRGVEEQVWSKQIQNQSDSVGWRLVAKTSSSGWAWDIVRLKFLVNGIEAKPGTSGCQVTESGSLGWPGFSPFKAFEIDGHWGGRMLNGRFWLGIKDCTSFADVTEIRLKQNEGHSVTDFTIEKYQCDVWQHVAIVHTTTRGVEEHIWSKENQGNLVTDSQTETEEPDISVEEILSTELIHTARNSCDFFKVRWNSIRDSLLFLLAAYLPLKHFVTKVVLRKRIMQCHTPEFGVQVPNSDVWVGVRSASFMSGDSASVCSDGSWSEIDGAASSDESECFIEGTLFQTPSGPVPVCKLRRGHTVYGACHSELQVLDIQCFEKDCGLVELKTNSARLIATHDHRVLIVKEDGVAARIAGDLQEGDVVQQTLRAEPLLYIRSWTQRAKIYKTTFEPDLPVAAFLEPENAILSLGDILVSPEHIKSRRQGRRSRARQSKFWSSVQVDTPSNSD